MDSMRLSTRCKNWANACLAPLNIRVESCSAERAERNRLAAFESAGHFRSPAFPLLPQFDSYDPHILLDAAERYRTYTDRFQQDRNDGYTYLNNYFTSPDAEIAYTILREHNPRCLIEVGSGNSTHLFREAIRDGNLKTKLICIDPAPRRDISQVADTFLAKPVEEVPSEWFRETLGANGILFIDSSHAVQIGNDVVKLFLHIVPLLSPGVLIHVHDIFLPYEYPRDIFDNGMVWHEQYLLQAILQNANCFELIWPGYFLQQTRPDVVKRFIALPPRLPASSFWIKKIG